MLSISVEVFSKLSLFVGGVKHMGEARSLRRLTPKARTGSLAGPQPGRDEICAALSAAWYFGAHMHLRSIEVQMR